jgi:glycosyltransferase involved in cell wall biosynthesis
MIAVWSWVAVGIVAALTAHAWFNARLLRRPSRQPSTVERTVSVLLPARNEVHQIRTCLASILAQRRVPRLEILVLDDGSTDGTADLVRATASGDPRLTLIPGAKLPPGWYGKPYACHQLAVRASGDILVFVDADVVLAPDAIAAAVGLLDGVDLVSPYPRLLAIGAAERLVQPLLPWSWLTFLPMRAVEGSRQPLLAAAGGQFLAITRDAYQRVGGHATVRTEVLEDIALARAVKRYGGLIRIANGARLATCRMYGSWAQLRDGYQKSLWAAFGNPVTAALVGLFLIAAFVAPPLVAVTAAASGAWFIAAAGLAGYLLGVLGRVITGRATASQVWPDAFAHPASVALFAWLLGGSYVGRLRGTLSWKGRALEESLVDGS